MADSVTDPLRGNEAIMGSKNEALMRSKTARVLCSRSSNNRTNHDISLGKECTALILAFISVSLEVRSGFAAMLYSNMT